MLVEACPCGSGAAYAACCGPLHTRAREAATPEELMRSRYAAYVLGELDHVFRTWHPRTRPPTITADPTLTWTGLTVLASGADWVELRATFATPGGPGALQERSRFEQRRGRWVYVDGDVS